MASSVVIGDQVQVSTSGTSSKTRSIDIQITETVFTPLACATLINEILKSLVYQKSQIPYPYNWLKMIVERKRQKNDHDIVSSTNFTVERHYRLASAAYDNLEEIMRNIRKQFESHTRIQEVLILFGTTPQCPKEVFTIKVPSVAKNHIEENHVRLISKSQHKILRDLFLSDVWLSAVTGVVTFTNMYILLKKKHSATNCDSDHFFVPNSRYNIPLRVRNTIVNLNYVNQSNENCCKNLTVFDDEEAQSEQKLNESNQESESDCEHENDGQWFQAKVLLTGFKDCFVNKVSASELW